jgi:CubicO group peptidase (beta-lactamase class C family)
LENISRLLRGYVEDGLVAGCSAAVTRRGVAVYDEVFGHQDREKDVPMAKDAIFRAYSMTKVFTAVTLLTLYDRGFIRLHDPVSGYLPSFKNPMVSENGDPSKAVPASREITILDLLTMTSGIPYAGPNSHPAADINRWWDVSPEIRKKTLSQIMEDVGGYPLAFHPGEKYMYGYSSDVLGGVIEAASGMSLRDTMREAVLKPLGLVDTDFFVPAEKIHRFAALYDRNENGSLTRDGSHFYNDSFHAPPAFESGGGGLVSTTRDITRFAQMLARYGELDGTRILSPSAVRRMASDHLNAEQRRHFDWPMQRGYGYGLSVRVLTDPVRSGHGVSAGEFGWDGLAGTWFAADPVNEMTLVFMTQVKPCDFTLYIPKYMQCVYGALAE